MMLACGLVAKSVMPASAGCPRLGEADYGSGFAYGQLMLERAGLAAAPC